MMTAPYLLSDSQESRCALIARPCLWPSRPTPGTFRASVQRFLLFYNALIVGRGRNAVSFGTNVRGLTVKRLASRISTLHDPACRAI